MLKLRHKIVLLSLGLISSSLGLASEASHKEFNLGRTAYLDNRYAEATQILEQLHKRYDAFPEQRESHLILGEIYFLQGLFIQARAHLLAVYGESNPEDFFSRRALIIQSKVYLELKQATESLGVLRRLQNQFKLNEAELQDVEFTELKAYLALNENALAYQRLLHLAESRTPPKNITEFASKVIAKQCTAPMHATSEPEWITQFRERNICLLQLAKTSRQAGLKILDPNFQLTLKFVRQQGELPLHSGLPKDKKKRALAVKELSERAGQEFTETNRIVERIFGELKQ